MPLEKVRKELKKQSSKKTASVLRTFFKTAPGQYGHKDIFIGVKVPQIRKIAAKYRNLQLVKVKRLLKSKIHEERLLALLILILKYNKSNDVGKKTIYDLYLQHSKYINNWDLVDLSAHKIVGDYLKDKPKAILSQLAKSKLLWERRIAIISTFSYIRDGNFIQTLKIAKILLNDPQELINKAVGWMLREIGKKDLTVEEGFLAKNYKKMPRITLRYAIERFPQNKRKAYLKGLI